MLEATRYMVTMPLLWSSVISQSTTYSNDVATSDDGTQMRRKINDAFNDATGSITAEQFALMKRSINNATNLHKQCLDDKRTIIEKFSIRKNALVDQYGISQKIAIKIEKELLAELDSFVSEAKKISDEAKQLQVNMNESPIFSSINRE